MAEDLQVRRRTEIDYLNGEVIRLAEAHGHPAPVNRRIAELVRQAEARQEGSPAIPSRRLAAEVLG